MKKILLISLLALAGCTSIPIVEKFPSVPKELLVTCPDLTKVDPNTNKLSDVLEDVVGNYNEYYECKIKVSAWIEWYNSQQKIFNSIK